MDLVNTLNKEIPKRTINQGIIAGNPNVYKDLQNRYFRMIYQLVREMGGDFKGENANDIYSETILFLYEKVKLRGITLFLNKEEEIYLTKIEGKKALLSTYLYEVARRKWLKSLDNPKNKKTTEYIDDYHYQFEMLEDEISIADPNEDEKAISDNFNNLSLTCQMMILLKKVCKAKHEEIADFRGIKHGAARNLFSSCWKNLMDGASVQRKKNRIQPQESKINIFDMLEGFLENTKTGLNKWLLSELAEKTYYRQLPYFLEKKLDKIISQNQQFDKQIKLLKELISFFDEKRNIKLNVYKQDKELSDYFEKRNRHIESKYMELSISSRFILLLHHVANTDKLKIAEFFELEDDISALKRIHECKIKLSDNIRKDKKMLNELINCVKHD